MRVRQPAKMLRLHFSAGDKYGGKPLYEAIAERCLALSIAGMTVLRGTEVFKHDEPVVLTVIDSDQNITTLMEAITPMLDTAVAAISDVEMIRIQSNL